MHLVANYAVLANKKNQVLCYVSSRTIHNNNNLVKLLINITIGCSNLFLVKAGGMRIVQHKSPSTVLGKDPVETIGLSNPPPNIQTSDAVETNSEKLTTKHEHTHEVQHTHFQKPAKNVPAAIHNHPIQQPRK